MSEKDYHGSGRSMVWAGIKLDGSTHLHVFEGDTVTAKTRATADNTKPPPKEIIRRGKWFYEKHVVCMCTEKDRLILLSNFC
ncbi:hypothetical protein TNCV_2966761 [Trichonephila clavipes]|nr:hypothetical protein TNCV_2966761 [Trichonephila clavipes]